jgi:uncharacterized protein (DUF1499 family)
MAVRLCLWLVLSLPAPVALGQAAAPAAPGAAEGSINRSGMQAFFATLKRPDSPNHWLAAPAGFVVKPDAVAPVYGVSAATLREAFGAVLRQTPRAVVVAESADGLHVVVTTAVFGFKDDLRVQFIAVSPQQSTLALYSSSRAGYWDLGTNRRRVEDWLARLSAVIAGSGG